MKGRQPEWGGATTQSAKRKEERNRQRGLTDLSGVCTCEGNKTDGQIKVQRDRQGEEERMARGLNSQGEGCTEYLGSVGQHQIPTSGDHRIGGGAALLTAPSGAGPRQEPHPGPAVPAPATRGRCRTVRARLGRSTDRAAAGSRRACGGGDSVDGQDRRTHSAAGCCLRAGSPRKAGPSC